MRAALLKAWRGRHANPVILACAMLALLLLAAWPGRAEAQPSPVSVTKLLCGYDAATCTAANALFSVPLGQPVYYQVTIDNFGPVIQIDLRDEFPAGFIPTGIACFTAAGIPVAGTQSQPAPSTIIVAGLALPANGKLVCKLSGSFGAGSIAAVVNTATVLTAGTTTTILGSGIASTAIDLTGPLPSDLRITKDADRTSIDVSPGSPLPHHVKYTITLENLGANDLYLGSLLQIQDRMFLKPNSVALRARLVSAVCKVISANQALQPQSDCLDTSTPQPYSVTPLTISYSAPQAFAGWRYPQSGQNSAGLLRAGDKIVLTVTVEVSAFPGLNCIIVPNSDGFFQEAHINLTLPPAAPGAPVTTLDDLIPDNNTSTVELGVRTGETRPDPLCNGQFKPKLAIDKVQISPLVNAQIPWSTSFVRYRLTVRNLSSTVKIRNIHLTDWVNEVPGTPPFTAAVYSVTNCSAPNCNATAASPKNLLGYGDTRQMVDIHLFTAGTYLGTTNSTNTFSLNVMFQYSNPRCDSFRDGAADRIRNILKAMSWEEVDGSGNVTSYSAGIFDVAVITNMEEAPVCPFLVVKKPTVQGPFPPQLRFDTPYAYTVSYESLDPKYSHTVGTLMDALRFKPPALGADPYAISLRVDYTYRCMVTAGTMSGQPVDSPGYPNYVTAYAVANAYAQQGVRLIQRTNVTFNKLAKLVCAVNLIVRRPLESDPYCSTGELENAALLDMSIYYNSNLPWTANPTGTSMWDHDSKPLPRCFNWIASKFANPNWIWPGGGPLSWTWQYYNAGPSQPPGAPLIQDQFTGPGAANTPLAVPIASVNPSPGCIAGPACTSSWIFNPVTINPGAPSILSPQAFGHGQTLRATLNVLNAPASVPSGGLICNNVFASLPLIGSPTYWKISNAQTRTARACVKVLDVGSMQIRKVVVNTTGIAIPSAQYQVNVGCTYPADPTGVTIPSVTRIIAPGVTTLPIDHIPVGSNCAVTEVPPTPPPPAHGCLYPVWQTAYSPLQPFITPQAGGPSKVEVTNTLVCGGRLRILKNTYFAPGPQPFTQVLFNVKCGSGGQNQDVPINANGPWTILHVPPGSCTLTEKVPPAPPGCSWNVSQFPLGNLAITSGTTVDVTVTNRLTCVHPTLKLLVRKLILVNGQSVPVSPNQLPFWPTADFAVKIDCGGGNSGTVHLSASNNFQIEVLPGVLNWQCKVEEAAPLPNPGNCSWVPPPPASQTVTTGVNQLTVDIVNNLVCPAGLQIAPIQAGSSAASTGSAGRVVPAPPP